MRSTCLKSTAQTYDGTSGKCGRPTGKEQSRLPDRYLGWTFAACLAPPNLAGFFLHDPLKERDPMREWFFYAIMALLVFGPLFLDELSRLHGRRETNRARPIVHGPISLVPDEDEQNLPSHNAALVEKTKEFVGGFALKQSGRFRGYGPRSRSARILRSSSLLLRLTRRRARCAGP